MFWLHIGRLFNKRIWSPWANRLLNVEIFLVLPWWRCLAALPVSAEMIGSEFESRLGVGRQS
jgi:hypothetical protein